MLIPGSSTAKVAAVAKSWWSWRTRRVPLLSVHSSCSRMERRCAVWIIHARLRGGKERSKIRAKKICCFNIRNNMSIPLWQSVGVTQGSNSFLFKYHSHLVRMLLTSFNTFIIFQPSHLQSLIQLILKNFMLINPHIIKWNWRCCSLALLFSYLYLFS